MLISVYAARSGYYSEESKRVRCETALAFQTISFMVYLLGGALVYSKIETWHYLDAVYWADCTILTIGFGDYAPKTHLGRSLIFPYAVGGVLILGLVIASIQSFLTQRRERKVSVMMKDKQHALLKRLQSRYIIPVNFACEAYGLTHISRSTGKINEDDFRMLRHIQEQVAQKQRWILLLGSGTTWFVLWFVSAAIFKRTETHQNWSYFVSLYFTFISLMTIGYGDFYPTSNAGKAFFVFWSLLAVPTITILVSSMGETIIKKLKDHLKWWRNIVLHVEESTRKKGLNYFLGGTTGGKTFSTEYHLSSSQNTSSTRQRRKDMMKGKARDESIKISTRTEKRPTVDNSGDSVESGPGYGKDLPYYHYQLIKEIGKVTGHLLTSPSREYTYNEWAWFQALITQGRHRGVSRVDSAGEGGWDRARDVSEPESHKEGNGSSSSDWPESGSYLWSSRSESQWMLEQLIITLKRELRSQLEEAE